MNRIEEKLKSLQEQGQKAFITYITAGLPDMEGCKKIILTQAESGTDIIELGVPFSDPIADGPVIQDASYKSILKGTNLVKCFDLVAEVRKTCEIPIVFMMYYNTIIHYGLEAFAKKCAEVGVDGLIVPDLPYEESEELRGVLAATDGAPFILELVSPVSGDRIPKILEDARGFVYCVSSMGVTGQAADFHKNVYDYLSTVKRISKIPVMMGFGIRTAADVAPMIDVIDGAIVGSAFIKLLEENDYSTDAVREYCSTFKKELNALGK
jgi:tryptophan synthase alpha chain